MDIEQLRAVAEQASFASLVIGFTTGFLFSFNPVALAARVTIPTAARTFLFMIRLRLADLKSLLLLPPPVPA